MTPQDPLSQLRDIHLPDPVSAWPPGPGWWILAALTLAALVIAAAWGWNRYRANRWRRQARSALNGIYRRWRRDGDDILYLQAANEILKRAALKQFPREQVAPLSGPAWEAFLDSHWRRDHGLSFARLEISTRAYRGDTAGVDIESVNRAGCRWIKQLRGARC